MVKLDCFKRATKQFLASVGRNNILFYLDDDMFRSLDHHEAIFTKLRIRFDIVGTVYHLVIYTQSNKIHNCVSCWTAYILE